MFLDSFRKIPAKLAEKVANSVNIPIIGIGAGASVDGQVLSFARYVRNDS